MSPQQWHIFFYYYFLQYDVVPFISDVYFLKQNWPQIKFRLQVFFFYFFQWTNKPRRWGRFCARLSSAQQTLLPFCNFRWSLALWQRRTSQSPTVPQRGRSLSDYTCITLFPGNILIKPLVPLPSTLANISQRTNSVALHTPASRLLSQPRPTFHYSPWRSNSFYARVLFFVFLFLSYNYNGGKIKPKIRAG